MKINNDSIHELYVEYSKNNQRYGLSMNIPCNAFFDDIGHIQLENDFDIDCFLHMAVQLSQYMYKEGHLDYEIQVNKRDK